MHAHEKTWPCLLLHHLFFRPRTVTGEESPYGNNPATGKYYDISGVKI
jgi:hypothetical protein